MIFSLGLSQNIDKCSCIPENVGALRYMKVMSSFPYPSLHLPSLSPSSPSSLSSPLSSPYSTLFFLFSPPRTLVSFSLPALFPLPAALLSLPFFYVLPCSTLSLPLFFPLSSPLLPFLSSTLFSPPFPASCLCPSSRPSLFPLCFYPFPSCTPPFPFPALSTIVTATIHLSTPVDPPEFG